MATLTNRQAKLYRQSVKYGETLMRSAFTPFCFSQQTISALKESEDKKQTILPEYSEFENNIIIVCIQQSISRLSDQKFKTIDIDLKLNYSEYIQEFQELLKIFKPE